MLLERLLVVTVTKTPSVYCFLEADDLTRLKYTPEYYQTEDPEYAKERDWDRDNYEFVEEFTESNTEDWDRMYPLYVRIIKRKSDGQYFKYYEHAESWDDRLCLYTGEYGGIEAVTRKEVMKVVYE
jgi:hypothetical protein